MLNEINGTKFTDVITLFSINKFQHDFSKNLNVGLMVVGLDGNIIANPCNIPQACGLISDLTGAKKPCGINFCKIYNLCKNYEECKTDAPYIITRCTSTNREIAVITVTAHGNRLGLWLVMERKGNEPSIFNQLPEDLFYENTDSNLEDTEPDDIIITFEQKVKSLSLFINSLAELGFENYVLNAKQREILNRQSKYEAKMLEMEKQQIKQSHYERTELFNEIMMTLLTGESLNKTIINAMRQIGMYFGASRIYMLENSSNGQSWSCAHEWRAGGVSPISGIIANISIEELGINVNDIINSSKTYYIPDVSKLESDSQRTIFMSRDVKSLVLCAIQETGRGLVGIVGFDFCDSIHNFVGDDISFMTSVSRIISISLMRQRSEEEAQLQAAIVEIISKISLERNPVSAMNDVAKLVATTLQVDKVAFYCNDTIARVAVCNGYYHKDPQNPVASIIEYEQYERYITWERDLYNYGFAYIDDNGTGGAADICDVLGMKCVMAAPIIISGEMIGSLNIGNVGYRSWRIIEFGALLTIANILSLALDNANNLLQIQDRERSLRLTLNSTNDYIVLLGMNKCLLEFNDSYYKSITKFTGKEIKVGQYALDGFPIYIESRFLKIFDETMANMNAEDEVEINGKIYSVKMHKFYDQSKNQNLITAFVRDVTLQRQMEADIVKAKEEAEKANTAKSDFLANMSHEIRTPLNSITGFTYLLSKSGLTSMQERYTENIDYSAKALLSIVNDVLDYSKIEANKIVIENESFNFRRMISNLQPMFEEQAASKNLKLKFVIDERIPRYIMGDEQHLSQVFRNLLSNAVKYTECGNVKFKANYKRIGNESYLYICVTDTGVGIKDDEIDIVFSKFDRGSFENNRKIKGTGLGLAITKGIVNAMGGIIGVKSKVGQGSCFFIELPLVTGACNEEEKPVESGVSLTDWQGKNYRILLVDDNEINLSIAQSIMETTGLAVDAVLSADEAICMICGNKYDIVFMDHMMPDKDGIQATKEIRKMGYSKHELPIIALTANVMQDFRTKFIKAGMNDFLGKPIIISELERILIKYLTHK